MTLAKELRSSRHDGFTTSRGESVVQLGGRGKENQQLHEKMAKSRNLISSRQVLWRFLAILLLFCKGPSTFMALPSLGIGELTYDLTWAPRFAYQRGYNPTGVVRLPIPFGG